MKLFVIVLIAIIIFLILINFKKENPEAKENTIDEKMPYCKKYLLTKNEWAFYKKIKPLCDENNLHIIAKVRLADIVDINKGIESKERQKYFNKIKNKHIDFILCNPENMAIVALVELDDKSHERKDRTESDNFKNKLAETVGYKLIRVKSEDNFEEAMINAQIIIRA